MTSLRSELFNINKRLKNKDGQAYQNSRQNSNILMVESFDNCDVTRPSTKGFIKWELDPIDHERAKLKLKLLLQKQLKFATGKHKLEIERRLAQIDHPSIKFKDISDVISHYESNKASSNYFFLKFKWNFTINMKNKILFFKLSIIKIKYRFSRLKS